jgi:hypothetical protein
VVQAHSGRKRDICTYTYSHICEGGRWERTYTYIRWFITNLQETPWVDGNRNKVYLIRGGHPKASSYTFSNRHNELPPIEHKVYFLNYTVWTTNPASFILIHCIFQNYRPLSPREIKVRALSRLGPIHYNIIWSNCEHFAAWCRNDTDLSEQVGLQQSMYQLVPTNIWFGASKCLRHIYSTQDL